MTEPRVFLVYDTGDLISIHASRPGAEASRREYVEKQLAADPENERDTLERLVVINESPLQP